MSWDAPQEGDPAVYVYRTFFPPTLGETGLAGDTTGLEADIGSWVDVFGEEFTFEVKACDRYRNACSPWSTLGHGQN